MSERRGGFFNPSLEDMNKEILGWDVYTMLSGEAMYELKKVPVPSARSRASACA